MSYGKPLLTPRVPVEDCRCLGFYRMVFSSRCDSWLTFFFSTFAFYLFLAGGEFLVSDCCDCCSCSCCCCCCDCRDSGCRLSLCMFVVYIYGRAWSLLAIFTPPRTQLSRTTDRLQLIVAGIFSYQHSCRQRHEDTDSQPKPPSVSQLPPPPSPLPPPPALHFIYIAFFVLSSLKH